LKKKKAAFPDLEKKILYVLIRATSRETELRPKKKRASSLFVCALHEKKKGLPPVFYWKEGVGPTRIPCRGGGK